MTEKRQSLVSPTIKSTIRCGVKIVQRREITCSWYILSGGKGRMEMTILRSFALLVLMLGAPAITRAIDYEQYGLTLCNSGELKFSVAVAAEVPGGWLSSTKWSVFGWITIEPKECKQVYQDQTWGLVRDLVVHVAFA